METSQKISTNKWRLTNLKSNIPALRMCIQLKVLHANDEKDNHGRLEDVGYTMKLRLVMHDSYFILINYVKLMLQFKYLFILLKK